MGGLLAPRFQSSYFSDRHILLQRLTLLNSDIFDLPVVSRFLLIFAACLLSLVGKMFALNLTIGGISDRQIPVEEIAASLATIFLPGLIVGLVSCWHRGILKTFIAHPSIILMPIFTHFAFASSTKWCKRNQEEEEGQEEGEEEEEGENQEKTDPYIAFSTKATVCNLLLYILGKGSKTPVTEN